MIIGISGKKQHGKDTVANIIKKLLQKSDDTEMGFPTWKIVRFADKLKDIVCLLLGCTREQLEDETFKNTPLSKEWSKLITTIPLRDNVEKLIEERGYNNKFTGCYYLKNSRSIDIFYIPTPRLMLQLVGTECGRNIIHPDVWVNSTMSEYQRYAGYSYPIKLLDENTSMVTGEPKFVDEGFPDWVIPDTRFPNELRAIKVRNGFVIRVDNPNVVSEDTHESETALDNCKEFDATIINDGSIENLVMQVKDFLIQKQLLK